MDEKRAKKALEDGYGEAEQILQDVDETERLLQRVETKLKKVPAVGGYLSDIMTFVSLVRSWMIDEYRDVPIGTIIAAVSAIAYFASPIDIIPDVIPGIGLIDDGLVVATALKLIKSDIDEYKMWRVRNNKEI